MEIKSLAGFTSPYFHLGSNGGMTFVAPVNGATTSGTDYARSELREMAGGKLAAWTVGQGGSMQVEMAVETVPQKSTGADGRIVIGQIHGKSAELARLYYENGKVYFVDDHGGKNNHSATFNLHDASGHTTHIGLGERFDYDITVKDAVLTVEAFVGGTKYSASEPVKSVWDSDKLYFKAGVYDGVGAPGSGAGTIGTGVGSTEVYNISVSHS